jgi:small subunit ribosomal protein S4e
MRMANKGTVNKQKRLSVATIRHLNRKEATWTIRQKPGTHTLNNSVPLGFVVRDMLKLAHTLREAKQIIAKGLVHVDGNVRKTHQFAVGLFDTVTIPSLKKNYRLILDTKGRLVCANVVESQLKQKPVKVVNKVLARQNKLMIQTHDGKTFRNVANDVRVGDSVLATIDGKNIAGHLSLSKGGRVLITGGSHVGEIAKIDSIVEGTMKRDKLVNLSEGDEKFQTTASNVMVIDTHTAEWLKTAGNGVKTHE